MQTRFSYFMRSYFLLALIPLALASCDKLRIMEDNQPVKDEKWSYDDPKTFTAEIQDTTIRYNLYINIRHSFQFAWRNVWVNIETTMPDNTKFSRRVNLVLSEPDGHWYAKCTGDNCYLQLPLQMNARFPQKGKYTFKVAQDMRVSPLNYVKAIGMRVEKAVP